MQTSIPFGSALAQKVWGTALAVDVTTQSYFSRKFIGSGENNVMQEMFELSKGAGDTIDCHLSVQLREEPVFGDNVADGQEESLRFFVDTITVDQVRKPISLGTRMTQKRTVHDLRTVGRNRGKEYWAAWKDEQIFMYMAGGRGANLDYVSNPGFTGFASNPFQAPDSGHLIYPGTATSKASITASDKMTVELVETTVQKARMMRASDRDNANMVPVTINGEDHFVMVMSPWQEHAMRTSTDAQGWLELQKAAAGSEGRSSRIFKGSLGMINKCLLHTHERAVTFTDYGAGANVAAARAIFMGRQAGIIAYGNKTGARMTWEEEVKDYGNNPSIALGAILGIKKTRYNGRDFGAIAIDTAAKPL